MQINGWRYYNHAAIPKTAPHINPNIAPIEDNSIWKVDGGTPFLARWTTEFDCGSPTNWWYIIKDAPFEISSLKAKRRYEINKGIKNYDVKVIDPTHYSEALCNVQIAAFTAYPSKYRQSVDKQSFLSAVQNWGHFVCIGAFYRKSEELCGYALLSKHSAHYVDFMVLKTNPEHEKNGVNAALVEGVLRHFDSLLKDGGYICDGSRSINHETAFQDYLEKYFGFRKAYCKLHIKYNPKIQWIIKLLYPARNILLRLDGFNIIHQLNSVMQMEEIVRTNNV